MNDDERQQGETETVELGGTDTSAPCKPPLQGRKFQPGNRFSPGGKPGNTNGQTHGLTAWMRAGTLPKSARHVRATVNKFRDLLEETVSTKHNGISLTHAALINSAWRHEGGAQLCLRWLRTGGESLPLADRLKLLAEISRFSGLRDVAIKGLGLDVKDKTDLWKGVLDATPKPVEGSAP